MLRIGQIVNQEKSKSHGAIAELYPPLSILAIVVVYRQTPAQCATVVTLQEAIRNCELPSLRCRVVVADNTPGGQDAGALSTEIQYRAYPENPGLALPYNDAIAVARAEGFEWLLTLDQDTQLPINFLYSMALCAFEYVDDTQVAAVVPWITDSGRYISPLRYVGGFLPRVLSRPVRGLVPSHASALNSASLLRVKSVEAIGGYDLSVPLHHSDTLLYMRLDAAGFRVAVANDTVVPHEFSILNRANRMSTERYRQMLEDDRTFARKHMSPCGRMERFLRLVGRAVKGILEKEDGAYVRVTVNEIFYRLLPSKRA